MDCHCPLCARKAEYTLKERKTGIDEYQIRCEFCRSYYIEEWQDDVLEEIGSDGRKLISEYTRRIQANNGITGLNAGNIRRIVYSQKFAEKAAAQYGLHPARVEHSGGFDGANMLFFVDADGKRFTLRVYKAAHTETEIRSQLHWMHALKTETGLSVPDPLPWPDGTFFRKLEVKSAPDPRFCVLFHWVEGDRMEYLPKESITPTRIENYGAMVAQMHAHAESFVPPDWFEAQRYDRDGFRQKLLTDDLDRDPLSKDESDTDLEALEQQVVW